MKYYYPEFKPVKKEIRIIGIDDSPFTRSQKDPLLVIGTVHRGSQDIEGILTTKITIDGEDSTDQIIQMINRSRHKEQLQAIMLDGIAVGGFNVIDIKELSDRTRLPVLVIMRRKPNMHKVVQALSHVPNFRKRLRLMENAGTIRELKLESGSLFFQRKGISVEKAREIILVSIRRGHMPEPIRCSHLIAAGIALGESKGGH